MTTRNQIYRALFARGGSVTWGAKPQGFVTKMRKWKDFAQIPPGAQPSLIQLEPAEDATTKKTGLPYRFVYHARWLVYFTTDPNDDSDLGADLINDIADALENCMSADNEPDGVVTLGGLVYRAEISDTIIKVPGDDNGAGMLVVPIQLLVP